MTSNGESLTSDLEKILKILNKKRDDLQIIKLATSEKLESLRSEKDKIEMQIQESVSEIKNCEKELEQLSETIRESETGYVKILEAGKTLMALMKQNASKFIDVTECINDKIEED